MFSLFATKKKFRRQASKENFSREAPGLLAHCSPERDKKGLRWTPLTTVPKKFHYFSNLKNVFKTWFRRPTNDLIELCFLWFYMCFCKKNHLNRYFETLYGLFSSWWPNRVIIWYYEPKKPKISIFWGIVCFVATFLQVLICKITRKTTWKNHKKGSTG